MHAYEQSVCPCIHAADHFLYLTYMYMFKYFCPPIGLMPCLCVRPSIYLAAYNMPMWKYVRLSILLSVCLSYSIFCPPFRSNRRTYKQSRGWSGGAKVLDKLLVPGRPTNLDYSRARAYCACSRCGWGLFRYFFSRLQSLFSLSLSLGGGRI